MLIGLPIFQNLRVDSCTLLEDNMATIDKTDFGDIFNEIAQWNIWSIGLMRIKRFNWATDREVVPKMDPDRPRENYWMSRYDSDPFPDPAPLDTIDEDQGTAVRQAIDKIMDKDVKAGLPKDKLFSRRRLAK